MSRSYKLWLLASLYLAQGLPYGFFTQALPVMLREQGLSLKAISATSLLFLPWMVKFLWAPAVDQYGERRTWLLILQLSSIVVAGALALIDAGHHLWWLFIGLFLFNLIAAAQDTVTDGLAVNLLSTRERGLANGFQVGAYRAGMILGGGLLLWIFAKTNWTAMFLGMAALLLLSSLPVPALREPARERPHQTARQLWRGWLPRLREPGMLALMGLICLYKFGDSMGASMVGPFMLDLGLRKEDIALIKGGVGSTVSLLGAMAGAWLAFRHGRRLTLLACGLLQSASLLLYLAAALRIGGIEMLWAASIAEHLFGAMATVALFTLMMDACDPVHASTDYTLLSCMLITAMGLSSFAGASLADAQGYDTMFTAAALVSTVGCLLLVAQLDRGRGPRRLQPVWRG